MWSPVLKGGANNTAMHGRSIVPCPPARIQRKIRDDSIRSVRMAFKSTRHEALFEAVLGHLRDLGYRDELIQKNYAFIDWFQPDNPVQRTIPAAAFSQTPYSYDSACIAVVLSNGKSGRPLIVENRALGGGTVCFRSHR